MWRLERGGGRQNPAKDNQWRSKGAGEEAAPVAARRGAPKSWQIVFLNLYTRETFNILKQYNEDLVIFFV